MANYTLNPMLDIWEVVLGGVSAITIIFMTLVGNILVVLSVLNHKPLKKVQNFLIISLAAADLSVASLVMPFALVNYLLGQWVFGSVFCDFWLTSDVFCCTSSILNLCAIALDRYWAINYPLDYVNKRTVRTISLVILAVYISSGIISIPPLLGWKEAMKDPTICSLSDNKIYVLYSAFGSFIIPIFVILFVYIRIYFAIRKRLRDKRKAISNKDKLISKTQMASGLKLLNKKKDSNENSSLENENKPPPVTVDDTFSKQNPLTVTNNCETINLFWNNRQKISLSKERKSARTMGIIIGVFAICWSPFFLMYVIMPFCTTMACKTMNPRIEVSLVWLGYVNSALNPIIYTIFNKDFRDAFRKLLHLH